MNQTCLVTGGAGFIGCAMSSTLVERFDHVVALDNLHPQVHSQPIRPTALHERVEFVHADVTHTEAWDALLAGFRPTTIVHLAAETGTGQSLIEGSRHASVNVVGTTRMLDALAQREIVPKRIVLASSRAVYGEGAWLDAAGTISYPGQRSKAQLERHQWDFPGSTCLPFEAGKTEPRPTSIYGATKLTQEHIISAWSLSFGVTPIILRLQNVYGPGQSLTNPYTGIVTLFAGLAREGKSIPVYEDGAIVRDFVFIEDVADAICRAAMKESVSAVPYDIGTGRATTILELARFIAEIYKAPVPVINGAYRHGDVRHAVCDITRAKNDLAWSPRVGIKQGFKMLCEWIDAKTIS
jgi:dTDP-L-rhamnose 4-epimerase